MRPVVLIIMDGWGYSRETTGNAIFSAKKPNLEYIERNYPSGLLQASGRAVGLMWGEAGNSEVGHLTLGAGRVLFQYISRINKDIESGKFFANPVLVEAAQHAMKNNSTLHIAGLLTSNSVHAYLDHLLALIRLAKEQGVKNLKLHLFTDGKDSGMKEAPQILNKVQGAISANGIGKIATIMGRDFPMERDNHWELTQTAFNLLVKGEGELADDLDTKLAEYYDKGFKDSRIPPTKFEEEPGIKDNDALILFNFREDSMRQITRTFVDKELDKIERAVPTNLYIAGMTQYISNPDLHFAYAPPTINNCLSEVVSQNNKHQFHIAETEKYAHVTYFFNGLKEGALEGEEDVFIQTEKDKNAKPAKPEMQTPAIAERVIKEVERGVDDFILINFANADILAHAGDLEGAIKGCEAVDGAIGDIMKAVLAKDGAMVITADHGNGESLVYRGTGEVETKHNQNPIPFYLIAKQLAKPITEQEIEDSRSEASGLLSDVAPTVLDLLGLPKPDEMTGDSLLRLAK